MLGSDLFVFSVGGNSDFGRRCELTETLKYFDAIFLHQIIDTCGALGHDLSSGFLNGRKIKVDITF